MWACAAARQAAALPELRRRLAYLLTPGQDRELDDALIWLGTIRNGHVSEPDKPPAGTDEHPWGTVQHFDV